MRFLKSFKVHIFIFQICLKLIFKIIWLREELRFIQVLIVNLTNKFIIKYLEMISSTSK